MTIQSITRRAAIAVAAVALLASCGSDGDGTSATTEAGDVTATTSIIDDTGETIVLDESTASTTVDAEEQAKIDASPYRDVVLTPADIEAAGLGAGFTVATISFAPGIPGDAEFCGVSEPGNGDGLDIGFADPSGQIDVQQTVFAIEEPEQLLASFESLMECDEAGGLKSLGLVASDVTVEGADDSLIYTLPPDGAPGLADLSIVVATKGNNGVAVFVNDASGGDISDETLASLAAASIGRL